MSQLLFDFQTSFLLIVWEKQWKTTPATIQQTGKSMLQGRSYGSGTLATAAHLENQLGILGPWSQHGKALAVVKYLN